MKVIRNTPEHLIVGDNPVLVGIFFIVMMLVFAGLGIGMFLAGDNNGAIFGLSVLGPAILFYVFVRRVQLIFDSTNATLTIQRKNLRRTLKVVHDLADVESAEVESRSDDDGITYRVTLALTGQSAGKHPITQAYSNIGDHHGVASAINAWLDSVRGRT